MIKFSYFCGIVGGMFLSFFFFIQIQSAGAATILHVDGGGTGAGTLTGLLQGNGTGAITAITGTAGQFPYYNGSNTLLATSSLFLATSGNVGIGSTTPTNLLSLDGGSFDLNGNTGSYKEDNVTVLNASTTNQSVMVGPFSGTSILPGMLGNVALGYQTLQRATTTNNNVAIGWQAMKGGAAATAMSNGNVAIGAQSLMSITTGTGVAGAANTGVGSSTLRLLTTGQGNVAVGNLAGNGLTTGLNNTIVGGSAERGNVSNVSAFGVSALAVNTGTGNSAFGLNAMVVNTTGLNDTFGQNSLSKITTQSFNAAFGALALASTTGSSNAAFGYNTGLNLLNTSSASSTFIGSFAGRGSNAGYGLTGSVFIGASSGYNIASSSNWNTCIGTLSCMNLSSGADNIIIGSASTSANDNLTTGSDNIKIGDNISFPNAAGSGQLNIGNLIFGTGLDGVGSTLSSGNIGIATNTPGSLLSVQGVANFTTATSTFYATGGIVLSGGCITYTVGGACIGGSGGGSGTVGSGTTGQFPYYAAGGTTLTATSTLFLATSGNVGIGTASPQGKLDVWGGSGSPTTGDLVIGTNSVTIGRRSGTGGDNTAFTVQDRVGSVLFSSNGGSADTVIGSASTGGILFKPNQSEAMRIINGGNVGIGTTTPSGNLVINGTTGQNLFQVASSTNQGILVLNQNGFLGVGTTTPGTTLSIQGVANFVAGAISTIYNDFKIIGSLYLPSLGTPAGSFLAVDGTGKVIATTTPSSSTGTTTTQFYATSTSEAIIAIPVVAGDVVVATGAGQGGCTSGAASATFSFKQSAFDASTTSYGIGAQSGTSNCASSFIIPATATTTETWYFDVRIGSRFTALGVAATLSHKQ